MNRKCKASSCAQPAVRIGTRLKAEFCSPRCAVTWSKANPAKVQQLVRKGLRAEKREGREKLKSRRDYEREAQRAFNAYIRERDLFNPCICCGGWPKTPSNHQWDAGHYRSTGAAPQLRFNEDNCHRQMVACNRSKSGNAVSYRMHLMLRIGVARVEALENNNTVAKRDIDELKAIRKTYQTKLRDLRSRREMWGAVA